MLQTLFPPVLGLLRSADSDVALAAVPLLGSYINKLKLGLKRSNNVLPEVCLLAHYALVAASLVINAGQAHTRACGALLKLNMASVSGTSVNAMQALLALWALLKGRAHAGPAAAAGGHHAQHCGVRRVP